MKTTKTVTTLTFVTTHHKDTPREETWYWQDGKLNGEIGWRAGAAPWTWEVIANKTDLDPEVVIDQWLEKLTRVVNEGVHRRILKKLKFA